MTNPNHTDTSRSGDLVERLRGMDTYGYQSQLAWEAADRIEALEVLEAELTANERMVDALQFALRDAVEAATENARQRDAANHRIEALEAENERLRGVLEAVWKEATTMRNASKLVGPYPKEPASNRVWARSMYHAGKKLHELIKPVRAALGEKQ